MGISKWIYPNGYIQMGYRLIPQYLLYILKASRQSLLQQHKKSVFINTKESRSVCETSKNDILLFIVSGSTNPRILHEKYISLHQKESYPKYKYQAVVTGRVDTSISFSLSSPTVGLEIENA